MNISKKFETLRNNFSENKELILRAIEHVEHHLRKHQYKIVGGFSIDANLRLKGEKLYEDDQLPDYDFYSPRHWETAYELHDELCALGLPVDTIVAVHTTTMRVRVDDVPVADITYVPEEIYNRIPTQEYRGFAVVHPHITMLDQMHALSTLYENPPNEVIVSRAGKDIDRFQRLYKHYPFEDCKAPEMKQKIAPLPNDCLYTGWSALAQYLNWSTIPGETEIICKDYNNFIKTKKIKRFRNMSLSMSKSAYYENNKNKYRVFDTFGEKITYKDNCVSIVYLLYYFLNLYYIEGDADAKYGIIASYNEFMRNPQVPTDAYGDVLWNMSTIYNIASIISDTRTWKPRSLGECALPRPKFNPETSPLFAIDGQDVQSQETMIDEQFLLIKDKKEKEIK